MAVLIVTNEQDVGSDFVVLELEKRGVPVVRCNAERMPRWRVSLRPGVEWSLTDPLGRSITSQTATGVWWRRPEHPLFDASISSGEERMLVEQWQAFTEGLSTVGGPLWISVPAAIAAAEDKARQLAYAASLDLPVPDTLWTNDISNAHAQLQRFPAVAKTVTAAHWESDGEAAFVFAHRVEAQELPSDAETFAGAPTAIQAMIAPKRDVRVTVIGDVTLAAETASSSLDWRTDADTAWTPHQLPEDVAGKCAALVDRLGLAFGGIDLALDSDGVYWFLEINPNGEWGWLQACGLPIASTLADLLTANA